MAYDIQMAERVLQQLKQSELPIEEKKMFGGLCFMVDGKMCVGVEKDRLMIRFDPARQDELTRLPGCTPMDFTGRIMKGYVFVGNDVLKTEKDISFWVKIALDYNIVAKVSKKKRSTKTNI